jgi:hypothetical protein
MTYSVTVGRRSLRLMHVCAGGVFKEEDVDRIC